MIHEIVLPLRKVKDGTIVRKLTGTYKYTVDRVIKVGKEAVFKCDKDSVILHSNDSVNFYTTSADTKVIVEMDYNEVSDMIEEEYAK